MLLLLCEATAFLLLTILSLQVVVQGLHRVIVEYKLALSSGMPRVALCEGTLAARVEHGCGAASVQISPLLLIFIVIAIESELIVEAILAFLPSYLFYDLGTAQLLAYLHALVELIHEYVLRYLKLPFLPIH